ncbi:MAG: DUF5684 domain-containing protein [Bacteroidota bacterium]
MEEYIALSLVAGLALFMIAAVWTVYEKAGHKGWEALIPFYNLYVLTKIVGKPGSFMALYFIPIVSWFAWAITAIELSKKFGRSEAFGFGLFFLYPIFLPILAWGEISPLADLPENEPVDNTFVNEAGETIERIPVEEWEA